jgi:sugar lactone lactonase YvrE
MAMTGQAAGYRNWLAAIWALILLLAATPTIADAPSQHRLATLHTRPAVTSGQAALVGSLPPRQSLHLAIALPLRNEAGLKALLKDLYDPRSPNYRHYLSVGDFTELFGPAVSDYDALIGFAAANRFQVTATAPNRMLIEVDATVADIERAFHVKMRLYRHPTENRNFYAPDREPTTILAIPVWHITGLDTYALPQSSLSKRSLADAAGKKLSGSGPNGVYLASDMRAAYYGGTLLTGAGQTVGLFQFGGYWSGDVTNYFSNIGQTNNVPIQNVLVGGVSNCSSACEDTEEVADIVQTIGMAPGLSQVLVYAGSFDSTILNRMATDNAAKQISVSWFWTPVDPGSDDPIFEEFAAQGQSIFIASGDCGAYVPGGTGLCNSGSGPFPAQFPAEDENVTAVGGTALATTGPGGAYISETAWSGSGGGYADSGFVIPSYQAGIANSNNNASTSLRNVPDVAADAIPDSYYCDDGACDPNNFVLGGTSLAAPRWAGFMALVNEQAAQNNTNPVGFLNPTLYAMLSGQASNGITHDITSGSNDGFSATSGYDLVTGWGSPKGQALINALAGPPTSLPAPVVTSLSPTSGPATGGTSVIITGTNLAGTIAVSFGGTPATVFSVKSSTEVTATAPAEPAGTVAVTVTTGGGVSAAVAAAQFTYVASSPSVPSVTSLNPSSGPAAGGTSVVISGANLAGATAVSFGGTPATSYVVNSSTKITATTPAESAGTVYVTVTAAGNTSADVAGAQYTYTGSAPVRPAVTSLDPTSGPIAGGTSVVITGTNLAGATAVSFGGTPASGFTIKSNTQITATAPAEPAGTVDVTVSTAAGTSSSNAGDQYTYIAPPPANVITLALGHLVNPVDVAVDGSGNIFVADAGDNTVKEITAASGYSIVTTLVAASGNFNQPYGIAVDGSGNVFVADTYNNTIKEIVAAGGYTIVNTLAINGNFSFPSGIAVDGGGNLFVLDFGHNALDEIPAAGGYANVATLAAGHGNFNQPYGVAVDGNGNVFVADTGNNEIKEVLSAGGYTSVTRLAGSNGHFAAPRGVAIDGSGNVIVGDTGNGTVKEILAAGGYTSVETVTRAAFTDPEGLALDGKGNIFIADAGDKVVKEILLAPSTGPSPLAAAILPGSRSVQTGTAATVFATMLNTGSGSLSNCLPGLPATAPAGMVLDYRPTNPATNQVIGVADQPVAIAANGSQSFVLAFSDGTPAAATALPLVFSCTNVSPAPTTIGLDTVDLVFSATPIADIIVLSATATNDGTVHIASGAGAFAVATIDAGAAGSLTASTDTGSASLPLTTTICETNSAGQCLAPPSASVPIAFAANATPTFSIFANASAPIGFAPGTSRIFVRFTDGNGVSHGATSVAVTTN